MMGGKGYYWGSSVLVSGTAGTGKSTLAATFVDAACRRGERAVHFAFEESRSQVVRNMRSIGIDLEPHLQQGLLEFHASRPTMQGLETHLAAIYKTIRDYQPRVVVVDPITNFFSVGTGEEVKAMLMRLVDFLKSQQVTSLFTSLTQGGTSTEQTDVRVSSLIDTWLLLRDMDVNGERNRVLYLLKSRGMSHSNQVREFFITDRGLDLVDAYTGPEGVLTGSARVAQEARERLATLLREQEIQQKQRVLDRKRQAIEAEINALRAGLEAEEEELRAALARTGEREAQLARDRLEMARSRREDASAGKGP